jgi:hypothetical protein
MTIYLSHANPPSESSHIPDGVFKPGVSSPLFIAILTAEAAELDATELRRLDAELKRQKADFQAREREHLKIYGEDFDEDGWPIARPGFELSTEMRDAIIDVLKQFCGALLDRFGPDLDENVPSEVDAIADRYSGCMLGGILSDERKFIYNRWCSYDLFVSTIAYLERARELNCLILVDA